MKVFRNPNRGKNANQHPSVEPYEPEHVRLNVKTIQMPPSREEFRRPAPKFSVPPQVKVNSGNVDGGWMPQISNQERTPPIVISRANPMVRSISNDFYNEPLASAAIKDFSTEAPVNIKDSEVSLPEDEYSNSENLSDLTGKIDFTTLMTGEYVLIYDNDILAAGDLDDITSLVENILTSDEYNVNTDKLAILKKMSFRTGVLISD
jgi:hypothetical protein